MFEFHGWLSIQVDDDDDASLDELNRRELEAERFVRSRIAATQDGASLFDLLRAGNGMLVLIAHGLRNHRYDAAIQLFQDVSREAPDSYGALFVRDDESTDSPNAYRVFRFVRGGCHESVDEVLSKVD